jgi:hypothetical protein
MAFPRHVQNSNQSSRFRGRRFIVGIIILLLAGLTFGVWFFFIYSDAIGNNDSFLPPDCYSINGKQICPKR